MMRSSVPTKRISWIFDIGDLRSGHFCDLPITYKSMGQKINSVIFTLAQAFLSGTISYRTVQETSSKKLHYLPLQSSFEVTRGHQQSFANNFWSKRDRDVGLVSVRSSWPGKSSDMQYDPFRSSRDLGLTRPEVKLWPWPLKVILYMVRRALTRQTGWYQIRCSIFKIKDFIVEKTVLENFGILTPGDSNFDLSQKWPKWFRNGVQTPSPPAGGGKSRGPAGRGLNYIIYIFLFYIYFYIHFGQIPSGA